MTNKWRGWQWRTAGPPLREGWPSYEGCFGVEFGFDLHWLRRLDMAREIDWSDAEEIGILLQEKYPEIEPYSVRFTDLHQYVIGLPGFVGDPTKSNEGILEAIQTAWNEEWEDAK
jgi:FeS assembly protein IscX